MQRQPKGVQEYPTGTPQHHCTGGQSRQPACCMTVNVLQPLAQACSMPLVHAHPVKHDHPCGLTVQICPPPDSDVFALVQWKQFQNDVHQQHVSEIGFMLLLAAGLSVQAKHQRQLEVQDQC
eukprot:scaffold576008_cov46-Prasinocladus_malaysianus.AAC.1